MLHDLRPEDVLAPLQDGGGPEPVAVGRRDLQLDNGYLIAGVLK